MPRTLEITVSPDRSEQVVNLLRERHGVLGIRLQRGASIVPTGDVITVDLLDRSLAGAASVLHERVISVDPSSSMTTSGPLSVMSAEHAVAIANDTSEATWEEMDRAMAADSNTTLHALLVMAISGLVATVGISQDALHLVVAAMVIAPGFQPILRGVLRLIAQADRPFLGWRQLLEAYGALLVGAGATALLLPALGEDATGGSASYLPPGVLIEYWTTISPMSILVALIGGVAGALLIASNRSVLTAGVMVALALVPSAAITAIGLVQLDFALAAQGAARWALEVALVAGASTAVFFVKRATVHGGRPLM